MPPKSKRQRQSSEAAKIGRETLKKLRQADETIESPETTGAGTSRSTETTQSGVLGGESRDPHEIPGQFLEDWVLTLDRMTRSRLPCLCHLMVTQFQFTETRAAEFTAELIHKSDRTVRQWRTDLVSNDGVMPESKQGRYLWNGVLWSNEDLNQKASEYVRSNASVKGRPNMTTIDFCKWVNKSLLPNWTLEPGFPRKISVETARKWLHHTGFDVLQAKKGIFVDGHERPDVIEYRQEFLRKMVKIGFLHFTNAPTEDAGKALPDDPPVLERRSKTAVFFHDESTFQSNEDQSLQWGLKGTHVMKPKSKGAGIMVSDFIDEYNGFLALTDDEYKRAAEVNPSQKQYARAFLEYGENREGYWNRDRFIDQMKQAVEIAEIKYPKSEGWRHVWVFDHSSCHNAMADDALDVNKMNVNPGGKQRIMRDTVWQGKAQSLTFSLGIPKGMKRVLQERGVDTTGMIADDMRKTLGEHDDFKNEKSMIEHFLLEKGHIPIFLPKYHPELNPIERVWAQLKRYTKGHCKYTLPLLRKNIPLAYDSVTIENIQNHFRKVRHFMFGYIEGLAPGKELP